MQIKLSQPLAADSPADSYDVRQMKKTLNRLGYYMPYEQTGITGIPDTAMFDGLKRFQADHNFPTSGIARPDDDTITALNEAATKVPEGTYIWRTVGDGKVRPEHAQYNGTTRSWSDSPDPGEDFNCRCWAEPIQEEGLSQKVIGPIKDQEKWSDLKFKLHFFMGGGRTLTLSEIGFLSDMIAKAREVMFKALEDQIADKMREMQTGSLVYTTNASYNFGDVHPYFGGGTIRTRTEGTVTKNGDTLSIKGIVYYQYEDTFTDPFNIRQKKYGTSSPENVPYWELKMTDRGGTYFKIIGDWTTSITGDVNLK